MLGFRVTRLIVVSLAVFPKGRGARGWRLHRLGLRAVVGALAPQSTACGAGWPCCSAHSDEKVCTRVLLGERFECQVTTSGGILDAQLLEEW
jgi:hypothetical protein